MISCYFLRSQPSPTRGYIGFTVDPERRLQQHHSAYGAKATKQNRPWEFVVVVSGFGSQTAAKCFEFAWQQPRTPWRSMQALLRQKGLLHAHASYTALNGLTKDLVKDDDDVVWRLRVLAVMLSMDVWKGLTVCFASAADKERARVRPGAQQPLAIERSAVQVLPAAAPRAPRARAPIVRAEAAPKQGGKKRAREDAAGGEGDSDGVIVVDD